MTTVATSPTGGFVVEAPAYALEVAANGMTATLRAPGGARLATLRPLAAFDTVAAPDETLAVAPPRLVERGASVRIAVERRSTVWERAQVVLTCTDDGIELRASAAGRGRLAEVHLLAARSLLADAPGGFLPSGSSFRTLFSPNPGDPGRVLRPAGEPAVVGVVGDSQPGRGHWFFTPAPLWLALAADEGGAGGWLGLGLAAPVEELTFTQLVYEPGDRAFSLRLDHEGHTEVDGEHAAPALLLTPGLPDPYEGLRRHRLDLVERGAAPPVAARETPGWWLRPIFCGWGAQRHLAGANGHGAPSFATQARYDAFLGHLEAQGLEPGTVVVDDKWQAAYGTCLPDPAKWPDLRGWIAARHARGQRVLLWWKAWDAEGLPPGLCVRNPDGAPVAVDPTNPAAREAVRLAVAGMLAPGGLDADGLKVDFTGAAPSGLALSTHGPGWGVALLHELLRVVHGAAKAAKPDALVITHTPHPSFVDVTDMVRLNDMLRLDDGGPTPDVVAQMRYRAAVVRAACPELPIDTDDWCVPDRRTWRAYLEAKPELGVPALYYADHLDATGEALTEDDYAALRRVWERPPA